MPKRFAILRRGDVFNTFENTKNENEQRRKKATDNSNKLAGAAVAPSNETLAESAQTTHTLFERGGSILNETKSEPTKMCEGTRWYACIVPLHSLFAPYWYTYTRSHRWPSVARALVIFAVAVGILSFVLQQVIVHWVELFPSCAVTNETLATDVCKWRSHVRDTFNNESHRRCGFLEDLYPSEPGEHECDDFTRRDG